MGWRVRVLRRSLVDRGGCGARMGGRRMIVVILICTLIGWLCGAPLIGLAVGVALFLVAFWADEFDSAGARYRRRHRRRR